jgi:putative RNA 2'-phosphotransferase
VHRKELQRFAKVLTYVLGVRPDEFGLVPDSEGFVEVKALLQALREEREWSFVDCGHLLEIMHSPDRARFEMGEDRIRASAAAFPLVPEPVGSPPQLLYHAVRRRAHPVALLHGLRPAKGPWVILAITRDLAERIGKRRDPAPVILEVKAEEAARKGIRFHATQGLLFLAESIPPPFLTGPPAPQEPSQPEKRKPEAPVELPGSFLVDMERDVKRTRERRDKEKALAWRRQGRKEKETEKGGRTSHGKSR